MEIILSKQCESLTGSLGRGFGYFIVRRGKRFFSQRSRHSVPPDGHWRFILTCAQLAQNKLHIADLRVAGWEIFLALQEAGLDTDKFTGSISTLYNANEVVGFGKQFKIQ